MDEVLIEVSRSGVESSRYLSAAMRESSWVSHSFAQNCLDRLDHTFLSSRAERSDRRGCNVIVDVEKGDELEPVSYVGSEGHAGERLELDILEPCD